MTYSIQEIVQAELEARAQLSTEIMSIILLRFEPGIGHLNRGVIQDYIYESLGFHGKPGNAFARFINKIMEENGYRKSYYVGRRCYYGIKVKAPHSA